MLNPSESSHMLNYVSITASQTGEKVHRLIQRRNKSMTDKLDQRDGEFTGILFSELKKKNDDYSKDI